MGYSRQKLQILGGGFNCLLPKDKVPITDYLLAENWRSDSSGRLISRQGYVPQFSIPAAGLAHSAANMGGASSPYYVGVNSGITAPAGSLYYDGREIATGFDGNRIGFASQNGFMYAMNRGNQGRHSAAGGWENWNLAAPPAAPEVAAASTPSYVGSVTYTYTLVGTTVAANIATGLQTVTPASMSGISVGMNLTIWDAFAGFHYEIVVVTAVTGTTFSAVFTLPKTGPVTVSFTDYVHYLTIGGATYSLAQNGYGNYTPGNPTNNIASILASFAAADTTCSVTYDGLGNDIVITPIITNELIAVSGSDGNPSVSLGSGEITSLPNGTYTYYLTYQSKDSSLESNPSSQSAAAVTVDGQAVAVTIPAADQPTDPRIGFINVYRAGGTLGQAYRVGSVPYPGVPPITFDYIFLDSVSDATATANDYKMETTHDKPPAARGVIGPYFGRLYAWSTAAAKNRLFYTPPNEPQYWSTDEQVGDWVDVGLEDEEIVWCSIHGNVLVIYKERTIWMIIGTDPSTATLEQVYEGMGLANAFALAPAGAIDYFGGPNGLQIFDMNAVRMISGNILPLFNQKLTNDGTPLTPPGSVLPGTAFNSNSTACYAIALGHALGRLYISYAELTSAGTPQFNLLVFDEGKLPEEQALLRIENSTQPAAGRWFYHRNAIPGTIGGFFGFFFDGTAMVGLTGAIGGAAQGFNIADFRGFLTEDPGAAPIRCVYQSHYEDSGFPDNDKMWLEVAIDYEFAAGAAANVSMGFNNGVIAPVVAGSLSAGPRRTTSFGFTPELFPANTDGGVLARNLSVLIDATTTGLATIHNVYIYFYVEARLAVVASTIPLDLGVGKNKECKELQLDIDTGTGTTDVAIASDLPGNALAIRQSLTATAPGRGIFHFPFTTLQGFLWQVVLGASEDNPFRLYSARLLMRVIGVFVEAYESAGGFVWDSMETPVGAGDVSTLDQLRFDMETLGTASVTLSTDLPGEVPTAHGTYTLATAAMARAWVTVPLPDGIEARSLRVTTTGAATYRLYRVQVRHGHIGRYLAGATPSGNNDQFRTLEFDLNSERIHMFKRIEVDLRTDLGLITMNVFTSQDGAPPAIVKTQQLEAPYGRQTALVIMPPGARGRLLRVQLIGAVAARVYKIRVWTRSLQESDAAEAAWHWADFPLEDSPVLPAFMDILQPPDDTSSQWSWVDLDFSVTEAS